MESRFKHEVRWLLVVGFALLWVAIAATGLRANASTKADVTAATGERDRYKADVERLKKEQIALEGKIAGYRAGTGPECKDTGGDSACSGCVASCLETGNPDDLRFARSVLAEAGVPSAVVRGGADKLAEHVQDPRYNLDDCTPALEMLREVGEESDTLSNRPRCAFNAVSRKRSCGAVRCFLGLPALLAKLSGIHSELQEKEEGLRTAETRLPQLKSECVDCSVRTASGGQVSGNWAGIIGFMNAATPWVLGAQNVQSYAKGMNTYAGVYGDYLDQCRAVGIPCGGPFQFGACGGVGGSGGGCGGGGGSGFPGAYAGGYNGGFPGGMSGGMSGGYNGGFPGGMSGGYNGGYSGFPGGMSGGYAGMSGGYAGMSGGYPGMMAGGFPGGMSGGYPGMAGGYAGMSGGYAGMSGGGLIGNLIGTAVGTFAGSYAGGYPGMSGGYNGGYPGMSGGYNGGYAGMSGGFNGGYAGMSGGFPGAMSGGFNGGYNGGYAGMSGGFNGGYAGMSGGYSGGYDPYYYMQMSQQSQQLNYQMQQTQYQNAMQMQQNAYAAQIAAQQAARYAYGGMGGGGMCGGMMGCGGGGGMYGGGGGMYGGMGGGIYGGGGFGVGGYFGNQGFYFPGY